MYSRYSSPNVLMSIFSSILILYKVKEMSPSVTKKPYRLEKIGGFPQCKEAWLGRWGVGCAYRFLG